MSATSKAVAIPPPAPSGAVVPISDTASILQIIERATRDPSVDIEKMERLFRMHQEMRAREEEREFNAAMQAAQAQLPKVLKDRENTHTRSRYATLDTIIATINPVITSHGFAMSFGTEDSPYAAHYRVSCVVSHSAGHTRTYHADVPADSAGAKGVSNKNMVQAVGSAITYARRYLTLLIFNLSTGDDDDGHAASSYRGPTPPPAPRAQPNDAEWIAKIENAVDKAALNKVMDAIGNARIGDEAESRLIPYIRRRKQDLAKQETVHVPESRQGRQPLPKHDPTTGEIDEEAKAPPAPPKTLDCAQWSSDCIKALRRAGSDEEIDQIEATLINPHAEEAEKTSHLDYQDVMEALAAVRAA